jgi:LPXTG-motif cell wall-anchored protein
MVSTLRRMCMMTAALVALVLPAAMGIASVTAAPVGAVTTPCPTVYEGAKCDPVPTTTPVSVQGISQSTGSLPRTGSDVWPFVQMGLVLVVGGTVLVVAVRHRRVSPI